MQYADFSKFAVNPDHEALVDSCYEAGKQWRADGNTKLPMFVDIAGKKIPVARSTGDCGQAFVRGWKGK